MEKFEVYLAGRIANLSYDEAVRERNQTIKRLKESGIHCLSPMRGKGIIKGIDKIDASVYAEKYDIQEIIGRDLHDIRRCNAVLVLTGDTPSWGTTGEFWFATWVANKPTLVICNNHAGGWVKYYATKVVSSLDEAIEVLNDWKHYWCGDGIYDME